MVQRDFIHSQAERFHEFLAKNFCGEDRRYLLSRSQAPGGNQRFRHPKLRSGVRWSTGTIGRWCEWSIGPSDRLSGVPIDCQATEPNAFRGGKTLDVRAAKRS